MNLISLFSPAREFSQTLSKLSPGYEGMENVFLLFLIKLLLLNMTSTGLMSGN